MTSTWWNKCVAAAALCGTATEVMLVAYRRSALTALKHGENSGRTLAEYISVRAVLAPAPAEGAITGAAPALPAAR